MARHGPIVVCEMSHEISERRGEFYILPAQGSAIRRYLAERGIYSLYGLDRPTKLWIDTDWEQYEGPPCCLPTICFAARRRFFPGSNKLPGERVRFAITHVEEVDP